MAVLMHGSTVLILDGELNTSLTVCRSLSQSGYHCAVIAKFKSGAYFSRYAYKKFIVPVVSTDILYYWITKLDIKLVYPHYEKTAILLYDLKNKYPALDFIIVAPPIHLLELSVDKVAMINAANEAGLRLPKTMIVKGSDISYEYLEHLLEEFGGLYLKAVTEINKPHGPGNRYIKISRLDKNIFEDTIRPFLVNNKSVIIQESIRGIGLGIAGTWSDGDPVCVGGHVRIVESHPTGGVSVLAKTYIDRDALIQASKLMKYLSWTGTAMIEFKRTPEGNAFFMQVNPRSWGTLPLYVKSGANIPISALDIATDRSDQKKCDFNENRTFRFTFPFIIAILKNYSGKSKYYLLTLKELWSSKDAIWDIKDPLPFILSSARDVLKAIGIVRVGSPPSFVPSSKEESLRR